MRKALAATLLCTGLAQAQPAFESGTCPTRGHMAWVPDAQTARAIYVALANSRPWVANLLQQYPIVKVEDHGATWAVWQEDGKPLPKAGSGEVVVQAGGGQLSMSIDKCTGAVTDFVFNR